MKRAQWLAALAVSLACAAPAWAIKFNDIAVGTDTGIGNGSVYALSKTDLHIISSRDNEGSTVVDVGFQTNRTPQPPNTPPNTFPGFNPLEAIVSLTASGVLTNANANRLDDKIINTVIAAPSGSTLSVMKDDTVFVGTASGSFAQTRDSGLVIDIGSGLQTFGDQVVDSILQKLPSGKVATAYVSGGVGMLRVDPHLNLGSGTAVALPSIPVDVDVLRQDPTLVVAMTDRSISIRDGLTLAPLASTVVGTPSSAIVQIATLVDHSIAVALYDSAAGTSQLQILAPDLSFVRSSLALPYEITAMDNQNIVDTLIVGTSSGEVKMIDSANFGELFALQLGNGEISAIVVNAPEPGTLVLCGLGLVAAAGIYRRRK